MLASLARLGYASKALVYLIVGSVAIAASVNRGERVTDLSGALRLILSGPFGQVILLVLGVGLCGYALWRILDAIKDPDRRGHGAAGVFQRVGDALRGCIYGAFGIDAFRLLGGTRGSNGHEVEMLAAKVMRVPFGEWLLGAVGLVVAGYGAYEVVSAIRSHTDTDLDLSPVPPQMRAPLLGIARVGVGCRAAIVTVLGVALVRAAVRQNPSEAASTRESILQLADILPGRWALAAIGAGLIAYAVDQGVHAWCRKIKT